MAENSQMKKTKLGRIKGDKREQMEVVKTDPVEESFAIRILNASKDLGLLGITKNIVKHARGVYYHMIERRMEKIIRDVYLRPVANHILVKVFVTTPMSKFEDSTIEITVELKRCMIQRLDEIRQRYTSRILKEMGFKSMTEYSWKMVMRPSQDTTKDMNEMTSSILQSS